jgi:PadR family transcriptional regulator, regulatory protein AphA
MAGYPSARTYDGIVTRHRPSFTGGWYNRTWLERTPTTVTKRERPAEYAILGLLHLDDQGGHGYDLARHFSPDQPLGAVLRLEPGMLYHHLKRLEQRGWVSSASERESSRPARQVYHLTQAGRDELSRWLQSPVEHTREIRLDFLVKFYFAQRLAPGLATALITTQSRTLEEVIASLDEERARLTQDASPADRQFLERVHALRAAQTRAAIDWLATLAR